MDYGLPTANPRIAATTRTCSSSAGSGSKGSGSLSSRLFVPQKRCDGRPAGDRLIVLSQSHLGGDNTGSVRKWFHCLSHDGTDACGWVTPPHRDSGC